MVQNMQIILKQYKFSENVWSEDTPPPCLVKDQTSSIFPFEDFPNSSNLSVCTLWQENSCCP